MLRPISKFTAQTTTAAGGVTSFSFPADRRYWKLLFHYQRGGADASQANMEADIDFVRVYINDKLVRECTAQELIDLNTFYGMTYVTGMLELYLSEPWSRNSTNDAILAWSMGGVSTFRVDIHINSSASSPVFVGAYAEWDKPAIPEGMPNAGSLPPLGIISKWVRRQVGITSTGVKDIIDLPTSDGVYAAIHMKENTASDVSHVKIELDQLVILDTLTRKQINQFYEMELPYRYNPVSDVCVVKFNRSGLIADSLDPKGKQFKVSPTLANVADIKLLCEIIGPVNL